MRASEENGGLLISPSSQTSSFDSAMLNHMSSLTYPQDPPSPFTPVVALANDWGLTCATFALFRDSSLYAPPRQVETRVRVRLLALGLCGLVLLDAGGSR